MNATEKTGVGWMAQERNCSHVACCVGLLLGGKDTNTSINPNRALTTDWRNGWQIPMHLLGLHIGLWVRNYRDKNNSKVVGTLKSPPQHWEQLTKATSLELSPLLIGSPRAWRLSSQRLRWAESLLVTAHCFYTLGVGPGRAMSAFPNTWRSSASQVSQASPLLPEEIVSIYRKLLYTVPLKTVFYWIAWHIRTVTAFTIQCLP